MGQGDPHDRLFRYGFGQSEVARAHFEAYLPAEVSSAIDWSGLEQVHETFIDEELKKTESDLLYRAPLKDSGEIFLVSSRCSSRLCRRMLIPGRARIS